MNPTELVSLLKNHKTYLQTHNFPDPDAISSAFGLQQFLKYHGVETTLVYCGSIDKFSTKAMLSNFNIEIFSFDQIENMTEDDYIVTIDGQKFNANFSDLPGNEVACIDHHPIFVETQYQYSDIRMTGACASIVTEYFVSTNTPIPKDVASALIYGIRMDTASFSRGVTELDIKMFGILHKIADIGLVHKMTVNTLELTDLKAYGVAIKNIEVIENVGFAYIPFECNDALIAMISDFILSLKEVDVSVVFANRNGGYKLSVRSMVDENVHAGKLIANALKGIGDGGGHAAMAGGIIFKEHVAEMKDVQKEIERRFMEALHQK